MAIEKMFDGLDRSVEVLDVRNAVHEAYHLGILLHEVFLEDKDLAMLLMNRFHTRLELIEEGSVV